MNRKAMFCVALILTLCARIATADVYSLDIQIIQVCDDAGTTCVNLDPSGTGTGYLYESQVNEIWDQAGIDISFTVTQWNNTDAMRLDSSEMTSLFNNTYPTGTGSPSPGIATDALQIFFVNDHSGTGFTGPGTGWVDNPLSSPSTMARNAGQAQLYIHGTTSSNGRIIMANEGFAADSLSGTISHEIGHALGLRHIDDINAGAGAGTVQDPNFSISNSTANLMWAAGSGPAYDSGMTLQQNFHLRTDQIDAAIFNGLNFDPDGNGNGVLQLIPVPEPSSAMILMALGSMTLLRRRRS